MMVTLASEHYGRLEGEYFLPDETASAAHWAQEQGLALYTLTLGTGIQLENPPLPEHELLGYVALADRGETIELLEILTRTHPPQL